MPNANPPYSHSLKHSIVSGLASLYLKLVGATTRIVWEKNPAAEELKSEGKNFIYAMWHSRQVFLIYSHRQQKVSALVSMSKDGEYMARVLKHFGFAAVRGSTSKGGTQALLGLIDAANAGFHPVLTPDGPRGPRHEVQAGLIFLAQKTGLPVVPIACGLSNKLVFKSWDRFEFPLPFGRAAIVYGNPVSINETDNIDLKTRQIKEELDKITSRADVLAS